MSGAGAELMVLGYEVAPGIMYVFCKYKKSIKYLSIHNRTIYNRIVLVSKTLDALTFDIRIRPLN